MVQFRVCPVPNSSEDPNNGCFDRNILKFENGQDKFPMNDGPMERDTHYDVNGNFEKLTSWNTFKVQLPNNLLCDHCVFQVIIKLFFC